MKKEAERLLRKYGLPVILPMAITAGIVDDLREREERGKNSMSEPYLRWHPVTGGYMGQAEICVIASRVPNPECYHELNRRTMERIHEEALNEDEARAILGMAIFGGDERIG